MEKQKNAPGTISDAHISSMGADGTCPGSSIFGIESS